MTRVATSCSPMLQLIADTAHDISSGKTSLASFRSTEDALLQDYWDYSLDDGSKYHQTDGGLRDLSMASTAHMAAHGEHLTLNIAEWTDLDGLSLNDVGVCSLSDVLETGDVPSRYYLSARACRGILRRAAKRNKKLPPLLETALNSVIRLSQHA